LKYIGFHDDAKIELFVLPSPGFASDEDEVDVPGQIESENDGKYK
jgi:hypothetical protein